MKQYITTAIIAATTSVIAALSVTTYLGTTSQNKTRTAEQQIVVVDFMNLTQRLMVGLKEQFSQQDLSNPQLMEIYSQSEARRLYKEVVKHAPNAVIVSKSQIVHSPDQIDITDEIATSMGLDELTEDELRQMVSGRKDLQPVGVN